MARSCCESRVVIIRSEWDSDKPNNGILSCRNGGGADEGFVFEDECRVHQLHIFSDCSYWVMRIS